MSTELICRRCGQHGKSERDDVFGYLCATCGGVMVFRSPGLGDSLTRVTRSIDSDAPDDRIVLEVVTRHLPARARALAVQQASLTALGPTGWRQTLLVDDAVRGLAYANTRLAAFAPTGAWVWVLDDDDRSFATGSLIPYLDGLPASTDLVIVRMDHGPFGVLPKVTDSWGWRLPPCGGIGASGVITRASLWLAARQAWGASYEGDYEFIREAWTRATDVHWIDAVLSGVRRISRGANKDIYAEHPGGSGSTLDGPRG